MRKWQIIEKEAIADLETLEMNDLKAKVLESEYLRFESCDSTQNQLAKHKHIKAVMADTQTKGRGRLGREWISTKGQGLYLSWRPDIHHLTFKEIPYLSFLVAGVMADLLNRKYPKIDCCIKWPNDLLVGTQKLGGILCEVKTQGSDLDIVVGIGLNLRKQDFDTSISLEELGIALDVEGLEAVKWADLFLDQLIKAQSELMLGQFSVILERWRQYQIPMGTRMKQREIVGTYLGIDDFGNLRLRSEDGQIIQISSGEVQIASILPNLS